MFAQPPAHSDMTNDSENEGLPKRRRRRSYDELAAASQAAAERALVRFKQKNAKAQRHAAQVKLRERKLDTRRKIIAGALALEHAKRDDRFHAILVRLLDEYVERPVERALFGLGPMPETKPKPRE